MYLAALVDFSPKHDDKHVSAEKVGEGGMGRDRALRKTQKKRKHTTGHKRHVDADEANRLVHVDFAVPQNNVGPRDTNEVGQNIAQKRPPRDPERYKDGHGAHHNGRHEATSAKELTQRQRCSWRSLGRGEREKKEGEEKKQNETKELLSLIDLCNKIDVGIPSFLPYLFIYLFPLSLFLLPFLPAFLSSSLLFEL